jgi:hypothetical protein
MYNEKLVLSAKKEIINRYDNLFLISKLCDSAQYYYDNVNPWNFYVMLFDCVRIEFNDDEEYENDIIEISIFSEFIKIIFRWLKLKHIYYFKDRNQSKQIKIYLKYNENDMKKLFEILDFILLCNKKNNK